MRIGLLSAVAIAMLASSGVMQAETISGTFTGVITHYNQVDTLHLFGGENLGATVTVSFSYDTDSLNTAVANNTNGSYYNISPDGTIEVYGDLANDGAVTLSATMGAHTYVATNNEGPTSFGGFVENDNMVGLAVVAGGTSLILEEDFYGNGVNNIPFEQLEDPLTIQSYSWGIRSIVFEASNFDGMEESFFISDISVSNAPEPAPWSLMTMGLGGIGLLKLPRAGPIAKLMSCRRRHSIPA